MTTASRFRVERIGHNYSGKDWRVPVIAESGEVPDELKAAEGLREYQQQSETYPREFVKLYGDLDAALANLTPTT